MRLGELARIVAGCVPTSCGVHVLGGPAPNGAAERYVPSTRRARQDLGLQTWIELPEAIRRTVSFCAGTMLR